MRFPHSTQSQSKPRFPLSRAAAVSLCLLTAFLFLGCPMGGSTGDGGGPQATNASLVGTWASGTGDGYIITENTVSYMGFDSATYGKFTFTGDIVNTPDFSATDGVIIIKYRADDKPDPATSMGLTAPSGDFFGIYWKSLSSSSVSLANSYKAGGTEETSLSAALAAFTLDNVGTYVSWAGVTAQSRKAAGFYNKNPDFGFLQAMWEGDNYDVFVVDRTSFNLYIGYMSPTTHALSGTIVGLTNPSVTSGHIFLKITSVNNSLMGSYASDDLHTGNYYAIRWQNKAGDSKTADFCLADIEIDATGGLEAAKTAFIANAGNTYFDDSWDVEFARY
ncbi:MAG: hypothetical protein LBD48_10185 [Treponema sp.]|jgi:hypothetical protein|nr:hypothetical protein [Treponema sp.]